MKMLQVVTEKNNLYRYALDSVVWYLITTEKPETITLEICVKGTANDQTHSFDYRSRELADAAISIIDL